MTTAPSTEAPPDPVITPARRRFLIIVLPLLALTVALTGVLIAQDLLPGTKPYDFTTDIAAVPELTVSTGRSGVDLELRASDTDRIRVDAEGGYSGPEPQVIAEGSRIEADCPAQDTYDCAMELIIELPAGTRVIATNRSGRIEASGLTDAADLNTRNGQIQVADATGPITAKTTNGEIRVGGATGPITADTSNGQIQIEDSTSPQVTARTRNANVTLELREPQSVIASTTNGNIEIDVGPCRPYAVEVDASGEKTINVPTDPGAQRTVTARARDGDVVIDCE